MKKKEVLKCNWTLKDDSLTEQRQTEKVNVGRRRRRSILSSLDLGVEDGVFPDGA